MSFRTTLRPVVWSHIDAHGKNRRRDRSPEDEHSSGDQGPLDFPPKKKKKEKAIGVPALYYPPTLSPSEKLWRDRSRFLFQRGYQLRPRYDPEWTPTIRGNGRHHHSGEDHIMQIVRLKSFFFLSKYFINWSIPVIPAPAGSGRDTSARWIGRVYQNDSRLQKAATNSDHGILFNTKDDGRLTESCRPPLRRVCRRAYTAHSVYGHARSEAL